MAQRHFSLIDQFITGTDRALRTLTVGTQTQTRPYPAENKKNADLNAQDKRHAAGLMRVNHSGEVCAQALYQGQALTAKLPKVRAEMEHAAEEEIDHLAWCEARLKELDSQPSALNPLWYGLSFTIGATAGLISDKLSLGFVAATEDQVCKHLDQHMEGLPANDDRSRAVVSQMRKDEAKHAQSAREAGGAEFPAAIKQTMTLVSKVMTESSYRI